jgi:ABC-2 type transport system permease protein
MRTIAAVLRRELRGSFNTPVAYAVVVAFTLFTSGWLYFVQGFYAAGLAELRGWFGLMPIVFAFLVPATTMRSWAEERRQGTYELLATMPATEGELVIGKFLAAWSLAGLSLLLTIPVPLFASLFGSFDPGVLVAQYLGVLLMAAAATAIGQWVSSRAKNQVSAFLASTLLLLALVLVERVSGFLGTGGLLAAVLNWSSLAYHYEAFSRGVLDSRDLAYYGLVTAFFLYLTAAGIRARRWS